MSDLSNMTLCAIRQTDGAETLGVVTSEGVIDVRAVAAKAEIKAPLTLDDLLQNGGAMALAEVIDSASGSGVSLQDPASLVFGRLFHRPGKIVCIGLNYRKHAQEIGMAEPVAPPVFAKFDNALLAHRGRINLPPPDVASHFDYETELLVVIGKTARNVTETDALSCVAGYCTGHDFSARDLQIGAPGGQWLLSKTLDGFAPIGPYFVSADQVPDPNNRKIKTWVNGDLRQSSSTADFIFNVQQIIAFVSRYWPLSPGDLIFTGTPEGVILGKPVDSQVWLKPGDHIASEVEGLGRLEFSLR